MALDRIYRVSCDRCVTPVPSSHGVATTARDARLIAAQAGYRTSPVIRAKGKPGRQWLCPDCLARRGRKGEP